MSALIFVLKPDQVLIAMDTLAVAPDTKAPLQFVSKVFPVPHLGGVICGTGAFPVVLDWFNFVLTRVVGRDILILDEFAPTILQEIGERHGLSERVTATIYHFGYLEKEGRFAGFAYRSERRFESQRLEYGLGMKPPHDDLLQVGAEKVFNDGLPKAFVDLMEQQKKRDEDQPEEARVGIGGEIHFVQLEERGYRLYVCHRFSDYRETFARMLQALRHA